MEGAPPAQGPIGNRDFSSVDPSVEKELPQPGPGDRRSSTAPTQAPMMGFAKCAWNK